MIDPKLAELADSMISLQFQERREQLRRELLAIQEKMSCQGIFRSSIHFDMARDLCAREVTIRAQIVFQVYIRFVSQLMIPITLELGSDLKKKVQWFMPVGLGDIGDHMAKVSDFASGKDITLGDERSHALKRVGVEIDVFILSALRRQEQLRRGEPAHAIYQFNSPVGVVQAGPGGSASVVQTIIAEDRKALLEALDILKGALTQGGELPGVPKDEILDLVEEGQNEIQKPKPNGLRLSTVLTTVANTIQGVTGLHQAYEKLKAALLPYGIMLP